MAKGDRLYLRGKTWWCWGLTVDGHRWQESTKQRDRRAAELAQREIERRYAADPAHRSRARLTVAFALNQVIAFQLAAGRADNTVRATRFHVRHLISGIDPDKQLDAVTLGDTTAYLRARLAQGASRHTVSKELKTLTQAMDRCAKLGLWKPERSSKHFMPDEMGRYYTPRERWLTREEYARLMDEMPKHRRDYLAAWTYLGLRRSELFSIRQGDYNAERFELKVRGTKTEAAARVVPVAKAVREMLERRCQLAEPFPEWKVSPCSIGLKRAAERAGMAPVTPNDLRRTFCSWLSQRRVPEKTVANLMGHTSTNMVRSVYSVLDLPTMASAIEELDL